MTAKRDLPHGSKHPGDSAGAGDRNTQDTDETLRDSDPMQGEGNYDAAREYNAEQQEFVASGKVKEAARAAEPKTEAERREMLEAERLGKERAKE
jgi:hypothetical protein